MPVTWSTVSTMVFVRGGTTLERIAEPIREAPTPAESKSPRTEGLVLVRGLGVHGLYPPAADPRLVLVNAKCDVRVADGHREKHRVGLLPLSS